MFKRKNAVDERIQKRTNELCTKMFPAVWLINAVFLIIKAALGLPFMVYGLEILILAAGTAVWLIEEMRYGTLFVKDKDEALKELSAKARMQAFYTMFWIVIAGEFVYIILVEKTYFFWVMTYILSWFPPCLIFTITAISEGLLAFGSRKKEQKTKKSLALRTAIGAVVFGIIMGVQFFCFRGGAFNPKGLLSIPLMAAGWGIPFYFIMTWMMKLSEKRADEKMKGLEDTDEE